MTPAQTTAFRRGAAILAAGVTWDQDRLEVLLGDAYDFTEVAYSLVLVAVVSAALLARYLHSETDAVLGRISGPGRDELLPARDAVVDRDAIVAWATALAAGDPSAVAAADRLDGPRAVNSAYDLALCALTDLGVATDMSSWDWAERFAVGAIPGD